MEVRETFLNARPSASDQPSRGVAERSCAREARVLGRIVDEKTHVRRSPRHLLRRRRVPEPERSVPVATKAREDGTVAEQPSSLIRLRPTTYAHVVSRDRAVLITGADGFVGEGSDEGWFVHETRLLSRYRWLVDGEPPRPIVLSNVEQDSWLGY